MPPQQFAEQEGTCSATVQIADRRFGLSPTLICPGNIPVSQRRTSVLFPHPQILSEGLWVHLAGHLAPALWLSAFDWRGLHNTSPAARGLHANTEPRIQEAAPFSVTVTAPALDIVSSPGAAVAQLFSAVQTGQIQALTSWVCGERLSPDVALTPLPSCMLFTFRCWHLLKERREEKKRGVCFYLTQTGIRNWQCSGSKHPSQTSWALWGCQELTGAWPWLKQLFQAKLTRIHFTLTRNRTV